MSRRVVLALAVRRDLERLADFLAAKSPRAAERALLSIRRGIASLDTFPLRGGIAPNGLRELSVTFGRDGYVIQYRVEDESVLVLRLFHALEDRRA